jgi:hypothetical protein
MTSRPTLRVRLTVCAFTFWRLALIRPSLNSSMSQNSQPFEVDLNADLNVILRPCHERPR